MNAVATLERLGDSAIVLRAGLRLRGVEQTRISASSLLVGASAGLFAFAGDQFASIPFFLAICALALAFKIGIRRFPPLLVAGVGIIAGSVLLSIPGAVWWGQGDWIASAIIANWVLLFIVLAFMRLDLGTTLLGLAPTIAIQAGIVIWEGMVGSARQAAGLIESPNPAGGLFVIAALFLLTSPRYKWLAVPCIVALAFTGSRLALLTLLAVTILLLALKMASVKTTLAIAAVSLVLVAPWMSSGMRSAAVLAGEPAIAQGGSDFVLRLQTENEPGLLPSGFAFVTPYGPPHNVPYRIANEWGYTAMLAWAVLTVWALARGILRRNRAWPLLLAVILLGSLDYYVHVGPLGWSWWLLLGACLSGGELNCTVSP